MKKLFVMAMAICGLAMSASAQTYIWKNNSVILEFPDSAPDSVTFNKSAKTTSAVAVDLGLPSGTKWADRNVGASSPVESGDYFAWGEVEPKDEYTGETYKYYDGNNYTYSPSILDAEHDAATVNWGKGWKMPTKEQMKELVDECKWEWCGRVDTEGYVWLGQKVTGPNGNSIFLPAAGSRDDSGFNSVGSYGEYWSSSLYEYIQSLAYSTYFDNSNVHEYYDYRSQGLSVRPVAE